MNDHQNDDLSKRRGRYVSHSASTPQGPKGVTTLRISGRVRGGSFVDPATPAASPNVKGAQENTSVSANPGNRCATRRSPRWCPTVDAEGKRSLGVQLNVLFRHFDSAAAPRVAPPPALTSHCMRAFTCILASPSTPMTHLAACPVQAASSRTSCRALVLQPHFSESLPLPPVATTSTRLVTPPPA